MWLKYYTSAITFAFTDIIRQRDIFLAGVEDRKLSAAIGIDGGMGNGDGVLPVVGNRAS